MAEKGETLTNTEKVLNHLDIGISVHSTSGEIIEANAALGRLLDVPVDELVGMKCHRAFHIRDDFIEGCPMMESIQSKKPESDEFFLNQSNKLVHFLTLPVLDEGGEVSSVIHVVRDITEKNRMEEAYEDIKMLDKMKEELVINVSHELRTPLQVVQAVLDLLSDEVSDEEDMDLLQKGLENLDRLNSLIGDIMKAVKLRETRLPSQEVVDINRPVQPLLVPVEVVERAPVDVGPLVRKCAGTFSHDAEESGITIECREDDDLPQILGDAKDLEMAFSHLIGNAIKFNGEGGSVTIEVRGLGDKVTLNVADTGVGIPKDKLSKIFDKFYQVDGSTTRRFEGTGLGLYITKGIVERHGGSIWAESEEGEGSKFIMVLPCG
jgi:PAS domain S-box-containing protein